MPTGMIESVASRPLEPAWKDALGLADRPAQDFYEDSGRVGNVPHAGVLRTTLGELGASAVFCVHDVPTVVIFRVDAYDPDSIARLHGALWNQGLASLLVVISEHSVRVFTLTRISSPGHREAFRSRCLVETLNLAANSLELHNLVYATESGRYWEQHSEYFDARERVDRVLLSNLSESHRLLREAGLSADQAQALLVQSLFVAYLGDRGIIRTEYFLTVSNDRADNFRSLLELGEAKFLERLFEALRNDFNGDLFVAPSSFQGSATASLLHESHLEILWRFFSGKVEMQGESGQYLLWARYDFKYIPIELISAVQDQFLGDLRQRRSQGAYYTPMFLADTLISQSWSSLPMRAIDRGRFLDPACGSGIFLVRIFQRLCEHRRLAHHGGTIPWAELQEILARLEGCDLDGSAVRVAVFSLYLALLEEVDVLDIQTLMKKGNMLPCLYGKTLCHKDFFSVDPSDCAVDVVVGNPPWSSRRGGQFTSIEWCNNEGLPAPAKEHAWAFVWKSLRHLSKNGVAALLLPAMGFLHNQAKTAIEARKRLFREVHVLRIVNFADLRFQLFDTASRSAALILLRRYHGDHEPYRFDYLVPKASFSMRTRSLIRITSSDRCRLESRMVEADPFVFKKRLWMSEPEGKLFNYLALLPRLGDLVTEFGTLVRQKKSSANGWVIGQGFKPSNSTRYGSTANELRQSEAVATIPHLPTDKFSILGIESTDLESWGNMDVYSHGFEGGYDGPRVLVPNGIAKISDHAGQRLRAAYLEDPMTFRDAISAITVPPTSKYRGKILACLLNSKLMLWFAFHGTSSFGAERPVVRQSELLRLPFPMPENLPNPVKSQFAADAMVAIIEQKSRQKGRPFKQQTASRDLLEQIDDLAYDFFCLSKQERILVDDTVEHTIPAVQPSRTKCPAVWRPSDQMDRRKYARTLVANLGEWLDLRDTVRTRLVARNDDLAILRLSLRKNSGGFRYVESDDATVETALKQLADRFNQPLPSNILSVPDFRVFVGEDLYLVKPVEKRFWLRSTALADSDSIALDLHAFAGRRDN